MLQTFKLEHLQKVKKTAGIDGQEMTVK